MPQTVARCAVRSYRTLSPLPVLRRAIGGLLSAALVVGSRRPGVTWHPALWSPDFPPFYRHNAGKTAIAWLTPRRILPAPSNGGQLLLLFDQVLIKRLTIQTEDLGR